MGKIYIPLSEDRIPEDIKMKLHFDDGYYFEDSTENRVIFNDIMPYGFRTDLEPIQIDLIPKNSWGASLANSLTKECWDSIRKPFIAKHGNRCQICGQRGKTLSNSIKDVDTHELWEYTPLDQKPKIQKLVGFLSLCSSCHLMFHLGYAKVANKYPATENRLKRLEKLNDSEIKYRIENIFSIWEARSQYNWKIDISLLNECGYKNLQFKPKADKNDFILK